MDADLMWYPMLFEMPALIKIKILEYKSSLCENKEE